MLHVQTWGLFITLFRTVKHWNLHRGSRIQSAVIHPLFLRSILHTILQFTPRFSKRSLPSLQNFVTKMVYAFLNCTIQATCPAPPTVHFKIPVIVDKEYIWWSSSLCHVLKLSVTFFLMTPNILLRTLFSVIHNLYSSLGEKPTKFQILTKLQINLHFRTFKFLMF